MSAMRVAIGPSILTADFLRLGEQIAAVAAAGVDFIHLDIMDGRFVPNISFGLPIVAAVRQATELPLDVHLMIDEPEKWVGEFREAGADTITFQVEATIHSNRLASTIREHGAQAGVALCPGTPLSAVEELVPFVDQMLVMSVNPGFGGQTFIPAAIPRIRRVREMIEAGNPACRLEVDGGVKPTNIGRLIAAGADTFVIGSSIFDGSANLDRNVANLREAAGGAAGA